MQFGIFTVGDVTMDPTTGRTPTEHERITATIEIAKKAEEVGLDVFATGEHHNPPFAAPANPPVLLAHLAAVTQRIILSTSTTLITTNDPVRLAEDYAYLQHLAEGRIDLMMGRGNTGPVYPWFGQDIRKGLELAIENYALLRQLWDQDVVDWQGNFRTPLHGFTSTLAHWMGSPPLSGTDPFGPQKLQNKPPFTATASSTTTSSGQFPTPSPWLSFTGNDSNTMVTGQHIGRLLVLVGKSSCTKTRKRQFDNSAPILITHRCTDTGHLWKTSPSKHH